MKKLTFILTTLLFVASVFSISPASASKLESLVMPGKLIEGHKKYEDDCSSCHSTFSKTSQTQLCLDCHKDINTDIKSNKGFHGRNILAARQQCKQCHTDHKGRTIDITPLDRQTFNHHETDFKLSGQHKLIACQSCHKPDKKFRETKSTCIACHKDDDAHDGKLGKECNSCHNETSWNKISFDHDKTDFPLKGKHKKALCISCHPGSHHKDTPKQCYACHALDDAHNGRYGKKCATCHNASDWNKAWFDHNKKTKFPLKGKHKKVLCDSCHTGNANIYKKKPEKTCFACHSSDDTHKGKNGKKCQSCHTTSGWGKSQFSHNKDTKFPLRGKHAKLRCNTCHMGDIHKNKLKTDCLSCHKVDDVHAGQQGKLCQNCHSELSWNQRLNFNHDLTGFPLIGQHAVTTCEECHSSHRYKDTSSNCSACHTSDDKHSKTLGPSCHQCHNPNSWSLWLFNHDKQTRFRLTGAHQDLHCAACHKTTTDGAVSKSSTCATCHYQDDKHRGGFGKNCEQCHNTSKFSELDL